MSRARHTAKERERSRKAGTRPARRLLTHRGVVFALVLTGLLFSSVYPMRRYFAVRTSIAASQQEERALDREAAELAAQKQRLLTDAAIEEIARTDLGMVRVGEVPFAVVQPGRAARVKSPPVLEEAQQQSGASLWSSIVKTLRRATRALR